MLLKDLANKKVGVKLNPNWYMMLNPIFRPLFWPSRHVKPSF